MSRCVIREIGERHRWVESLAVAAAPIAHGRVEFLVAPRSDAGLAVGRDIGCDQHAERRFDRSSTAEGAIAAGDGACASAISTISRGKLVQSPAQSRKVDRIP
jgi:hypothetical protein